MRHLAVLTLLAAAACAHAKAPVADLTPPPAARPPAPSAPQVQVAAVAPASAASAPDEEDRAASRDLEQALAMLHETRVLFETDAALITPEGAERLAVVGRLLARHAKLAVRIEGHCDERGTEDYNLVLGQKRAEAARAYLVRMGARDAQVGTVSYGAERPAVAGHDEHAWSQNRRDDFVPKYGGSGAAGNRTIDR